MTIANAERYARLGDIFVDFPEQLLPPPALAKISRFYGDLDAIGRIHDSSGEPLVDEVTLLAMLREFVPEAIAQLLVEHLAKMPTAAIRSAHQTGTLPREVSWFELANRVTVLDGSPTISFKELCAPFRATHLQLVRSVRNRFPSLEEEMLVSGVLPPRIGSLLADPPSIRKALDDIARQLGWWAALVAVLLVPPAVVTHSSSSNEQTKTNAENAWPLSMFVMAAAAGGWTLTVVGSCILAPIEQK